MAREIKFRAWSPFNKEMYMPDEPTYQGAYHWRSYGKYWGYEPMRGSDDLMSFDTTGEGDPKEHIIMMQYTGLLDKNEKEIYEGDIIAHDRELCNGEVRFWEGAFIAGSSTANSALVNYNAPMFIKVIGNIYEHPHLLS